VIRKIIFFEEHFMEFYQKCDPKVKGKIQYVLEIVRQVERVPKKFFDHISGSDGLYEIHVEYESNIYRIFCCFDKGRLVVLFNGFQKKSQKTSKAEIKKAEKLKEKYFKNKK
jgi:phage-related protein